jgi:glycosyltransferase involved in cell wall biosynthesis
VQAGHRVTLVTGDCGISGLELGKSLIQRVIIDGIEVVVVGIKYSNKQSFLRRIGSFIIFMFLSNYVGLRTKNVDVIYATSTPLTVGVPAMVLKWLKRIPFVFEVRDQWPQGPIEMGIIKNKILAKILLWLERTIYKQSSAIVALSPSMAEGICSVLEQQKSITIIPNSSDTSIFHPDIDGSAVREEHQWGDKLVLLHFGTMGRANGLGFVVDAADKLKANQDIHFVLVGNGSEKEVLEERIEQLDLKNIEIIDSKPKVELVKYVAACDISMVIFANFPIVEHNSANKFFDSLSAGKPILLNYSGWQREVIEEGIAGFGCNLCNLDQFVEKVMYLASHRQQLKKMGQNARRVAEERFNRDKLAKQALEVIESVCQG